MLQETVRSSTTRRTVNFPVSGGVAFAASSQFSSAVAARPEVSSMPKDLKQKYKTVPAGFVRQVKWIEQGKCRRHNCRDCKFCDRWVRTTKFVRRVNFESSIESLTTLAVVLTPAPTPAVLPEMLRDSTYDPPPFPGRPNPPPPNLSLSCAPTMLG